MRLVPRPRRRAAAAFVLLVAGLAATTAGPLAAPRVSLSASAGPLARTGRWMPVRIDVENIGDASDGEIVVDTGATRVHRAVALPSPSRKRLEMFVRAPGAEVGRLRVWLAVSGSELASVEVPVPLTGEDVTACVGATDAGCTVSVEANDASSNWRALDAADAVVASGPPSEGLSRWRSARALRQWIAPAVTLAGAPSPAFGSRPLLATYIVVLLVTAAASRRLARAPIRIYVVIVAVSLSGAAAVMAQGRVGPGSAIAVTQTVILRADRSATFVDARGSARFPSHDRVALRPLFPDLTLARRGSPDRYVGEDGVWHIPVDAAKGQQIDFEAAGFADLPTLTASGAGTAWRLTNAAPFDLVNCELPSSFNPRRVDTIPSGGSIDISGTAVDGDSALACSIRGEVPLVASDGAAVETRTSAVLIFDLAGGAAR